MGGYQIHHKTSLFLTCPFNVYGSHICQVGAQMSIHFIKGLTTVKHKEVTLSFLNTSFTPIIIQQTFFP